MKVVLLLLALALLPSCQNIVQKAARDAKYSAYELVGVQKRDLLKREVEGVREEQKEAGEDFKDALEKLKALYSFDGGKLEKGYRQVNSAYETARDQAEEVRSRIRKVETTAGDLFTEWDKEIKEIETQSLKDDSRRTLVRTQTRYNEMLATLQSAESKMGPVLKKLKDQVLYLKHNLNAKAIASLKGESLSIQKEIERLIKEMETSIAAADKFVKENN